MSRMPRRVLTVVSICLAPATLIGCGNRKAEEPAPPVESEPITEVATPQPEPASDTNAPPIPSEPVLEPELIAAHLETLEPVAKLGGRLFFDSRMSNPGANLAASCRTCHVPPFLSDGQQLYSDSVPLSVLPANSTGGKITSKRNAPTLQDATKLASFNADGAYTDLDTFLWAKLTSDHMGWEGDQEDQIRNEIHALMFNDIGDDTFADGTYAEQMKSAIGLDVETAAQQEVLDAIVSSLKTYLDTIVSTETSAYDAFAYLNRFNEGLTDPTDTPEDLAGRVFGRISNQEGRVLIRFPNVFDEAAYQGYKTFMRIEPTFNSTTLETENSIGSCVVCHVPPLFTDGLFHNTGVAQTSYDAQFGVGAFSALNIEEAEGIDLGRFGVDPNVENFAEFRTPGLRSISKTGPYFHDGSAQSLEEVIRHKIRVSDLAKSGKLRNPHPAFVAMNLTDADVPNLIAFLEALTEVPEEDYRDFRIDNVRIRRDPNAIEEE